MNATLQASVTETLRLARLELHAVQGQITKVIDEQDDNDDRRRTLAELTGREDAAFDLIRHLEQYREASGAAATTEAAPT